MNDHEDDHGLTVEDVPRLRYRPTHVEPGTEPCGNADVTTNVTLRSDLRDLRDIPLADVAAAVKAGDQALEETLRRIAPHDGSRVLLVAASFNSAI